MMPAPVEKGKHAALCACPHRDDRPFASARSGRGRRRRDFHGRDADASPKVRDQEQGGCHHHDGRQAPIDTEQLHQSRRYRAREWTTTTATTSAGAAGDAGSAAHSTGGRACACASRTTPGTPTDNSQDPGQRHSASGLDERRTGREPRRSVDGLAGSRHGRFVRRGGSAEKKGGRGPSDISADPKIDAQLQGLPQSDWRGRELGSRRSGVPLSGFGTVGPRTIHCLRATLHQTSRRLTRLPSHRRLLFEGPRLPPELGVPRDEAGRESRRLRLAGPRTRHQEGPRGAYPQGKTQETSIPAGPPKPWRRRACLAARFRPRHLRALRRGK